MSLDLYIKSRTPVAHRGTGVYIREEGSIRELKTKEEVLTYFPDTDPDSIEEKSYEDDIYFHCNTTHNLIEMANQCRYINENLHDDEDLDYISLFTLLWHPENINITHPTFEYYGAVVACLKELVTNPKKYEKYNPANVWGNYEQLVSTTKRFSTALSEISDNFKNYTIETWR